MLFRTNDTDRVPILHDGYDFRGADRLTGQRDRVEETDEDDESSTVSDDDTDSVERREALIATVVESVMSEQLRVMSQQLVTLRNMFPRYVVAMDAGDEGTDEDNDTTTNEERGTAGGRDDESSSSDGSFDESSSG